MNQSVPSNFALGCVYIGMLRGEPSPSTTVSIATSMPSMSERSFSILASASSSPSGACRSPAACRAGRASRSCACRSRLACAAAGASFSACFWTSAAWVSRSCSPRWERTSLCLALPCFVVMPEGCAVVLAAGSPVRREAGCPGARRFHNKMTDCLVVPADREISIRAKGVKMTDTANTARSSQAGLVYVPVADQDRALACYLDKLGFEKRADPPRQRRRGGRGDRAHGEAQARAGLARRHH